MTTLSTLLREFADRQLVPRNSRLAKTRRVTAKLQKKLHSITSVSSVSIDRVVPLGSYGKKTYLYDSDLDLHVFLNDELPPYTRVMREIAQSLAPWAVTIGTHGLKLNVNGIKVDLIITSNFRDKYTTSNRSDVARNQIDNVQHYLRNEAGPHVNQKTDFSTAVSEGAVSFERARSAFSHSMSRLAKFWARRFPFSGGRSLKGQSSIMEYLGARAAEDEERTASQDLANAFIRFLEMIAAPDDLCIYWAFFYAEKDIPPDILKKRPLLLDPTNPHDNFLGGNEAVLLKEMSPFARQTISRIDRIEARIRSGRRGLRGLFKMYKRS